MRITTKQKKTTQEVKEEYRQISEQSSPKWMDTEIKTK